MRTETSIITKEALGPIAMHGMEVLKSALAKHELHAPLTLGTCDNAELKALVDSGRIDCPQTQEAYGFAKVDDAWYLLGYDETGLMYGCQELLERLQCGEELTGFSGKPFTKTRGLYAFLHNHDLEEELFFSAQYWIDFFDEMARNRYNSFNLVFSHQTSYLVPMFAYFLDMPEFPDVYPAQVDKRQVLRNHEMLAFIARQAEMRGIDFILGIWQVSPWKNEQVIPVNGLTPENLREYTYVGMKHIISEFPAIKGLQIRANWESGIATKDQTDFFTNTLFKAMAEATRPFIFDFRCWLAEPQTVENALAMVPGTRLSCKYWAEFLGAPYQPAKISAGYSYSDFLRQPMKTDFIYQVWSLGSPRLLLWGDPAYVRRFVHSLTLGGGTGFEINLQLAQKGYGNAPGYWRIFKDKSREYYSHEYERYWLMNRLYGRISYDPDCPDRVWMQEMKERFGDDAKVAMRTYEAGSEIITFLIQYTLSDPNMYIWPEIDTNGLLDLYMKTPTSDECVIDGIEQYVDGLMQGRFSGKFTPLQSAAHFTKMARETLQELALLSRKSEAGAELTSLATDFTILAFLALYHAEKIQAAVALKTWYETRDIAHLRACSAHIHQATVYWERLISETENVYYDEMVTGPNDAGSWKTKRLLVLEDELHVQALLREADATAAMRVGFDFGPDRPKEVTRSFYHDPYTREYPRAIGYKQACAGTAYSADVTYGFESGTPQDVMMPAVRLSDLQFDKYSRDNWREYPVDGVKGFGSALLEDGVKGEGEAVFRCDLPDGVYEAEVLIEDQTEEACMRGPMTLMIGDKRFDDVIVYPGERRSLRAQVKVENGTLRIRMLGHWFVTAIRIYDRKPVIRTLPFMQCKHDEAALMTASVFAPSGVDRVTVTIGSAEIEMNRVTGETYEADLTDYVRKHTDVRIPCTIHATDRANYDARAEVVLLNAMRPSAVRVLHRPVTTCRIGEAMRISAQLETSFPVEHALLHYSYVNQFEKMQSVSMQRCGNEYVAEIPAGYPKAEWDLLYYLEIVDETGNGCLYPDFRERTPYFVVVPER